MRRLRGKRRILENQPLFLLIRELKIKHEAGMILFVFPLLD
jgi:hypothetical protein